jgi:hypothetical protein
MFERIHAGIRASTEGGGKTGVRHFLVHPVLAARVYVVKLRYFSEVFDRELLGFRQFW